ncbi:MAG: 3-methyl-2-oxobutanoate hydroxymethyltransferase [candidate division Zixibacteria bacterium]|nr:3-methyl-2-oxobutanoate hydroxymethyltransferase [candidate division Zixibacteria bacterium]
MSATGKSKKITTLSFSRKKRKGEKIVVLTAYDYYTARILEDNGVDAILVGDSLNMVLYGKKSTLSAEMDKMVFHTTAVSDASRRALVIGDMPFLSYQPSVETAILNAGRFLKEAGAEAVKLEGGIEIAPTIKRLIELGIPVMGHIGMTPQSINRLGGARVQGRDESDKQYIIESAQALDEAGCFASVLELMTAPLAMEISKMVKMATIGIGAGPDCDGQVLVTNDIIGMYGEFKPRFVRRYANVSDVIGKAVKQFTDDVRTGDYPTNEESFLE